MLCSQINTIVYHFKVKIWKSWRRSDWDEFEHSKRIQQVLFCPMAYDSVRNFIVYPPDFSIVTATSQINDQWGSWLQKFLWFLSFFHQQTNTSTCSGPLSYVNEWSLRATNRQRHEDHRNFRALPNPLKTMTLKRQQQQQRKNNSKNMEEHATKNKQKTNNKRIKEK